MYSVLRVDHISYDTSVAKLGCRDQTEHCLMSVDSSVDVDTLTLTQYSDQGRNRSRDGSFKVYGVSEIKVESI